MKGVDIEKKDNRTLKTFVAITETGKEFTFKSKYRANSKMNMIDAYALSELIQYAEAEEIIETRRV